jgi:hypothetical protein
MQSPWRLLLALLCISLVVAFGTIQAVHVHPQGDIHSDCSLCVSAHVGVQIVEAPVVLHVAPIVSPVDAVPAPSLKESSPTVALFTRPPPVDFVLA